jgi:hypothetical protein
MTEPLYCMVEIPKGSRNKYEWVERRRAITLDRFLFSSVVYPTDYGFIPDTLAEDGDPLDAMVCVSEATFPGSRVRRFGRSPSSGPRRSRPPAVRHGHHRSVGVAAMLRALASAHLDAAPAGSTFANAAHRDHRKHEYCYSGGDEDKQQDGAHNQLLGSGLPHARSGTVWGRALQGILLIRS